MRTLSSLFFNLHAPHGTLCIQEVNVVLCSSWYLRIRPGLLNIFIYNHFCFSFHQLQEFKLSAFPNQYAKHSRPQCNAGVQRRLTCVDVDKTQVPAESNRAMLLRVSAAAQCRVKTELYLLEILFQRRQKLIAAV